MLSKIINIMSNKTLTITFCEKAENHVGMQIIGNQVDNGGFQLPDLIEYKRYFEENGYETKLVNLNDLLKDNDLSQTQAYILLIRKGINLFVNADNTMVELLNLSYDTKAKMRGAVKNKRARHNLCFADFNQSANYEKGEGTIINFNTLNNLNILKIKLEELIKERYNKSLVAEANLYYDIKKTGIGYHGDSERSLVIGCRFGEPMDLCYRWYNNSNIISENLCINLEHGDIYFMSEKAVGTDWKKRKINTLRHAAGCLKYTL